MDFRMVKKSSASSPSFAKAHHILCKHLRNASRTGIFMSCSTLEMWLALINRIFLRALPALLFTTLIDEFQTRLH